MAGLDSTASDTYFFFFFCMESFVFEQQVLIWTNFPSLTSDLRVDERGAARCQNLGLWARENWVGTVKAKTGVYMPLMAFYSLCK